MNFKWIRKTHTLYSNKNEHEIYNWQKGCCSLIAFYSILKYSDSSMISSNFFMLIIFVLLFLLRSLWWSIFIHSKFSKKCDMSFPLWSRQKMCNLREIKRKCKKRFRFLIYVIWSSKLNQLFIDGAIFARHFYQFNYARACEKMIKTHPPIIGRKIIPCLVININYDFSFFLFIKNVRFFWMWFLLDAKLIQFNVFYHINWNESMLE